MVFEGESDFPTGVFEYFTEKKKERNYSKIKDNLRYKIDYIRIDYNWKLIIQVCLECNNTF